MQHKSSDDQLDCLDQGKSECDGEVAYREPLSGTGRAFPRCERHWDERLESQREIERRYPETAPADFDPAYAGERWDEE